MRRMRMEAVGIVLILVCVIAIHFFRMNSHQESIREKINSLGGIVISIEERTFRTGPFLVAGKGRMVYRIEYRIDGKEKEGWVKFGNLSGTDWRL